MLITSYMDNDFQKVDFQNENFFHIKKVAEFGSLEDFTSIVKFYGNDQVVEVINELIRGAALRRERFHTGIEERTIQLEQRRNLLVKVDE